jgi:DNA gyrase/topoisomerase IV subunit B
MYFEGTKNGVYVEVALQHNQSFNESVYSFVNNINTPEGGMHLVGFRNAITKTFNEYARNKVRAMGQTAKRGRKSWGKYRNGISRRKEFNRRS